MKLTATAASKGFSDVLSRVAGGETIEIQRHGHTVAVVVPPTRGSLRGDELRALLDRLPTPDKDFARSVAGLEAILRPPADTWPS